MIELRDYQKKGIEQLKQKIIQGKKKVIFWCATGGGKTPVMSEIVYNAVQKNSPVLTVMYGQDLVRKTHNNYKEYHNLNPTIYMGAKKELSNNTIASISTIEKNFPDHPFRVVILDEAHGSNAPSYQRLFSAYPDAIFIGFTATPFMRNGKPLAAWEDYVYPITMIQLREQKFLCSAKVFSPVKMDIDSCSVQNGEYKTADLYSSAMPIIGDIVQNYIDYGENRTTVLFAVNRNHAKEMAKAFNNKNIPAVAVDSESPTEERNRAIDDISSGKIRVLCSVNIFNQGIDIPSIGCVIMARPTMSECVFCQQIGRGLRPYKNKDYLIIIDNADNCSRHGLPYDTRIPSLENIKIEITARETVVTCKECFAVYKGSFCPYCGNVPKIKPREIKIIKGSLEEIICPRCRSNQISLRYNGPHIQQYCTVCSKHIKFMKKNPNESPRSYYEKMKRIKGRKSSFPYFMVWKKFGESSIDEIDYPDWFLDYVRK
jgi:DNA repair protein RadD